MKEFKINPRYENADLATLTDAERRAVIRYFEEKRLYTVAKIEKVATAFAKESGDKTLMRKIPVGEAPNDFKR